MMIFIQTLNPNIKNMKKRNMYRIGYLACCLIFLSCSGNRNQEDPYDESRQVYQEAIDIHDEVMPKMDRIMQLQKSLSMARENATDESLRMKIDSSLSELEAAHDGMMQWMRNIPRIPEFVPNGKEEGGQDLQDPDEMREMQSKSLARIKEIQNKFEKSILQAEDILESLNE
jgi:hypothetical protein